MIYEAIALVIVVLLTIIGVESIYVHELHIKEKELLLEVDSCSVDLKMQNNSIIKLKKQSEIELSRIMKARSDAMIASKIAEEKLNEIEKERIGKTCKEAMRFGLKNANALYECYQLDCNKTKS